MIFYFFFSYLGLTEGEVTEIQNDPIKMTLRDLGLGRKTNFKYPWRPDQSPIPNLCEKDIVGVNNMWDGDKPGTGCNEFIFTRA